MAVLRATFTVIIASCAELAVLAVFAQEQGIGNLEEAGQCTLCSQLGWPSCALDQRSNARYK